MAFPSVYVPYFVSKSPPMGILILLLRRTKVSTFWSSFFLSFMWTVNCILGIPSSQKGLTIICFCFQRTVFWEDGWKHASHWNIPRALSSCKQWPLQFLTSYIEDFLWLWQISISPKEPPIYLWSLETLLVPCSPKHHLCNLSTRCQGYSVR